MPNSRLWHLAQQLRQVTSVRSQSKGLWDDQAGAHVDGRYLRPHQQSAASQVDELRAHGQGLERVHATVRVAQGHYEESRIAGERVVSEVHEAEYAVSVTHDYIRRGLTNEGRAAQLQDQAVGAAEQANGLGADAPGEHGQRRVVVTFSPLAPRRGADGDGTFPITRERFAHIMRDHGPASSYSNLGRFAAGMTEQQVRALMNTATQRGDVRPNTAPQGNIKPGQVYEHDFGTTIGTSRKGSDSARLRVVVVDGSITSAFPY